MSNYITQYKQYVEDQEAALNITKKQQIISNS